MLGALTARPRCHLGDIGVVEQLDDVDVGMVDRELDGPPANDGARVSQPGTQLVVAQLPEPSERAERYGDDVGIGVGERSAGGGDVAEVAGEGDAAGTAADGGPTS
jgi:hypothetical protein